MEHHLAEWDEKTIRQWNYFVISFVVSICFCVFTQLKPPVFSAKSIQWNLSENAKSQNPCSTRIFGKRISTIVSIPMVSKLSCLFGMSMGYKKIFLLVLRMNSNSRKNINHPQSGYLRHWFTIHFYLLPNRQVSREKSEKWRVNSEKVKSTSFCRNLSISGTGWVIGFKQKVSNTNGFGS